MCRPTFVAPSGHAMVGVADSKDQRVDAPRRGCSSSTMSFRMRMAVRQQSRISSFGAGRTIGTKRNSASGCLCGKSRRVTNLIGQLNPWSDCLPSSATKARAAVGRSISSRYHAIGMRTVVFRESIVVEQHPIRARRFAALIVALTCLSCGGHSTPTAPASTVLDLVTGPYALTVTMSSIGDPICTNGVCLSAGLCSRVGDPPTLRPVTAAVRLDRSGDAISIRPEDASSSFRMELRLKRTRSVAPPLASCETATCSSPSYRRRDRQALESQAPCSPLRWQGRSMVR